MEADKKISSRSNLKRPFPLSEHDDHDNKPTMPKKARFPKGKKVKAVVDDELPVAVSIGAAQGPTTVDLSDPQEAAKERARRRSGMTTELFIEESGKGILNDVCSAEVTYKDTSDFGDHGIEIEPFNLEQEREEGYFDDDGNFVEYVRENEIKDAWLDSVVVDSRLAGKKIVAPKTEEETPDLSSDDIGKMKRRIADLLEPDETVLQALRRLKGTSTDRKEKMPEDIKHMFDQLTEDSMKLMENGDYNVYHEKREVFVREAEGYERIAKAKEGTSRGDDWDMFADDDENPSANDNGLVVGSTPESHTQPSSDVVHTSSESGDAENDYVYDESSGYYYSSTLGYYYDPSSGLYCSANSGKWFAFNEQTGTYEEVQGEAENPVS